MNFTKGKTAFPKYIATAFCMLLASVALSADLPADEETLYELMRTGTTDYEFSSAEDKAQAFLIVVLENKAAPVRRMLSDGYDVDGITPDGLTVLGIAYAYADTSPTPDLTTINLLEEQAKTKCDGTRMTFGRASETSRITVAELVATSTNKDFLEAMKSAVCQYPVASN